MPADQSSTYDPAWFSDLASVEEQHFWFQARNRVIDRVIRQIIGQFEPGYSVLEVGCGTGNSLRVLEKACSGGNVTGMDMHADALAYARGRTSCQLICSDITSFRAPSGFDIVCAFDVIEHIRDDHEAVMRIRETLKPGGWLFVTVPAHQSLWSYFDVASGHFRRYSVSRLRRLLTDADYDVQFVTEFMSVTFPLVWLMRRVGSGKREYCSDSEARTKADRDLRIIPGVNKLLNMLTALELPFITRRQ